MQQVYILENEARLEPEAMPGTSTQTGLWFQVGNADYKIQRVAPGE